MTPKFKEGQKVKIASNKYLISLCKGKIRYEYDVVEKMAVYGGKIVTIARVLDRERKSTYRLKEIDFWWDERLLEPLIDNITEKIYNVLRGEKQN